MATAITAENISKHYRLGVESGGKYRTLRESIGAAASRSARQLRGFVRGGAPNRSTTADHWALKDISFEISAGEAVGIIGRNGAGKSTLLKILSRITTPTGGKVKIWGRVGSLLEVGTGFHPELTGRENVFLNGAILGMGRREVARKFDAIVDFAEIDKFIDTPVKRYSSGMYVRLAFAVAAHMEPDILLIDEVLSVGDLAFQRKCLDHAKRLKDRDTTLLFVSHNMFAIKTLCDRAVFLSQGVVALDGCTEDVAQFYESESRLDIASWAVGMIGSDPAKCPIYIEKLEILNENHEARTLFEHGERMRFRIHFVARERVTDPNFCVSFTRSDNVACCNYNSSMDNFPMGHVVGPGVIEVVTPPIKLVSDLYATNILVWDSKFQRLLCAQVGSNFHVRHPYLNTEFGVFHESAEWCRVR